ncbi:MAG: hypothetical protein ACXWYN_09900 [Actinomycetota bacterium]
MVARERIAQLMREAEADRIARPLVEARRAARRERVRSSLNGIGAVFARRRQRTAEPVVDR